jgi:hypothetical protein
MSKANEFVEDALSGQSLRFSVQSQHSERMTVMEVVKGAVPAVHIVPPDTELRELRLDAEGIRRLNLEADQFARMHAITGPDGQTIRLPWVLLFGLPKSEREME